MGKLNGISFAGIDKLTDLRRLSRIQEKYPYAEFGVLISKKWAENGNRYFNPSELSSLNGLGLNLSAHLCGSLVREVISDNYDIFNQLIGDNINLFNRCQLNVAIKCSEIEELMLSNFPKQIKEIIVQQKPTNMKLFLDYFNKHNDKKVVLLIDGSCGEGKTSKPIMLNGVGKVGYAGGLNQGNIIEILNKLNEIAVGEYWLDMESGVRTDDWFDLDKVEHILEITSKYFRNDA